MKSTVLSLEQLKVQSNLIVWMQADLLVNARNESYAVAYSPYSLSEYFNYLVTPLN